MANVDMKTTRPSQKLHFGAAWYPEHWPEERWAEDIRLMQAAGLTAVRMAEFAWSTMEPASGKFNFAWLERAIQQLAQAGIVSVLGTPTAAPPAWLVGEYPAILAVEQSGRRVQFGNRCHYCVNSPDFHSASLRLVHAMGERFGSNPHVIGWQIDNEYNRVCYCDLCRSAFQQFLADKFGSLEALNQHWSTAYWSQTYSAWEQIPIPIGPHNPGLMLEFKNFISASYAKFQHLQIEALRSHIKPEVWITHNFMGWYGGFDHYEVAKELDLASWDSYIGSGHHEGASRGVIHDLTRGFKRRNFWLMETQPGSVNWSGINNSLNQGEARSMAWQAVAHGADAVLYWQWRPALGGQEQYHGSLVDQAGRPRPFYAEAGQIGREFSKVSHLLVPSEVKAKVAILNDYKSRWSIDFQPHHKDFDYVTFFNHFARPLAEHGLPLDVISADEPLTGYQLVIAPAMLLLDDLRAAHMQEFVRRGGHLVLTARCGMKDTFNALLPLRQPGSLAELAGVEVEDYYALDEIVGVKGTEFEGSAEIWAERLNILDEQATAVIARYRASNGWLDEKPAITVRSAGNGLVYYVGAWLDAASQHKLTERFIKRASLPALELPPQVEWCTRLRPDGQEIHFLINHSPTDRLTALPWKAREHLTGQTLEGSLTLAPYDVFILTKEL